MTHVAAGYIIHDKQGYAIYGAGESVDQVWSQVVAEAGPFHNAYGDEKTADQAFDEDFTVYGATAELIAYVAEYGGAIKWYVTDGIAHLTD